MGGVSTENLQAAKARHVADVVFRKKVEDVAKSPWVYRKLRNFRAGISCVKKTPTDRDVVPGKG